MFDYTLQITRKDGAVGMVGFQDLIRRLDMADELVEGAPLKQGGVPQVITFVSTIKKVCGYEKVVAFYNGQPVVEV